MKLSVSLSLKIAAFAWIAAGPALAQTPSAGMVKGKFVYSQNGNESAMLASLFFSDDGSITGTAVVRHGVGIGMFAVQGALYDNGDGSQKMTLSGTGLDAFDADGNPLQFYEVLMMLSLPGNSFASLRANQGTDVGELVPAAADGAVVAGSYKMRGKVPDPAGTSIEMFTLDPVGIVTGRKIANVFGQIVQRQESGSATMTSTGFQKITMVTPMPDDSGTARMVDESYLALPAQNEIRMLQTLGGSPTILFLTK